jgi:hypothetical protein
MLIVIWPGVELLGVTAWAALIVSLVLSFAASSAVHFDLFLLCRRWLLDGRSRRVALEWVLSWMRVFVGGLVICLFVISTCLAAPDWRIQAMMLLCGGVLVSPGMPVIVARAAVAATVDRLVQRWPWRWADTDALLPAFFATTGILAGLLLLWLGDKVASALSVFWPLMFAALAIILVPTGVVEQLFPDEQPAAATTQQLDRLCRFTIEERHFHAYGLLATSCAICLERFSLGERATALKCRHVFHDGCVMPWLSRRAATCPSCRAKL